MRKTTVKVFLALAWLLPACQITVPVILTSDMKLCHFTLPGLLCNNSVYSLQCVTSRARSVFGLVALLNIALLPLLFILFTYTKIFVVSYQSCKSVRRKAAHTCLPHLLVLISFASLCTYDVITARLGSDFPKTVSLIMTLQAVLYYSLFNPVKYGLKMKEISKQLKTLFCQAKAMRP